MIDPASGDGRIPVTVIGGFLGAGKTTLLNRLIQQAGHQRLAVLVNDFGAINVDSALIDSRSADVISLSNGCVCCQIGDDLSDALTRVIEARPAPQQIVIEASGVSDPWKIAQVSLVDPALALNAVLVLIDASSVRERADDPRLRDTIVRQLNAADLLVINKIDLVASEELPALEGWLTEVAGGSPRYLTRQAQVPTELLLGAGHRADPSAGSRSQRSRWPARLADAHGEQFESFHFRYSGMFGAPALRELLKRMPSGVLRLKGLVRTDQHAAAVLQFAGRHGSLRAWMPPTDSGLGAGVFDGASALVAIGLRGRLPVQELDRILRAALQ